MTIQLSQNIRMFRKQGGYTQEQLAEALGVTVGAVSKWETGLSVPDISLIVEMADFFETSVDVLLGYNWRSGSMGDTVERIRTARKEKDYTTGQREADKALQKYPNSFDVVYQSAVLYQVMGVECSFTEQAEKFFEKSEKLFRRSLELISQNQDKDIDEFTIKNEIASICSLSNRIDEAIEIYKETNVNGCNNAIIGYNLAISQEKYDEGLEYLSKYMIENITTMMYCCAGYVNVYVNQEKAEDALGILEWYRGILIGLKKPDSVGVLDRFELMTLMSIVAVLAEIGQMEKLVKSLHEVWMLAKKLEGNEDYGMSQIRYFRTTEALVYTDFFGTDVMSGIEEFLKQEINQPEEVGSLKKESVISSDVLLQLWEDIKNEESKEESKDK